MLRQLQIHRQIINDLSTSTLALMPVWFERLTYLASLRDSASGHYVHERLAVVYPRDGVREVLAQCHEEIFERVLEMPLETQEQDLRDCLKAAPGGWRAALHRWQGPGFRESLIPEEVPVYLKELFGSNLRALLAILCEDTPTAHSSA